ncbi:MAG: hypothetical protein ACK4GT_04305 [Pararhodobacter sp.]
MIPASDSASRRHLHQSRPDATAIALRAALIGSVAALSVVTTLGILGRREGRSVLSPINATSHILHGDRAGEVDHADAAHTIPGALINHASAIFWALPYTWWLSRRNDRSVGEIALGAAATGAVAGLVDYGIVPRRLTPGWEHAVSPRTVAAGFGALALGLALGALMSRRS